MGYGFTTKECNTVILFVIPVVKWKEVLLKHKKVLCDERHGDKKS